MPPRRRKELSLGAACFELPAAPDCELPKEPSPAAWRIQFFNDEGDKELFGGLAISCSAGRTLALQNAPRYFLPLRMDMKLSRRAWQLLLKKAADSLSKRQGRPSRYAHVCARVCACPPLCLRAVLHMCLALCVSAYGAV